MINLLRAIAVGLGVRRPEPDRYACPWCNVPERWPGLCGESVPGCVRTIERRCMDGDHRRCETNACAIAARWFDEVHREGVAAGAPFAVVSTIHNRVEVIRTADTLDVAHEALRAYALHDQEGMTMVFVVRGVDGALL